jgi:hypothetical protein
MRIDLTVLAMGCLFTGSALAQQGDGTEVTINTHVFKPAKVPATPERIAQLKSPPDFRSRHSPRA